MVPEIKSYSLIEGEALEAYKPRDSENFSLILRLIVGPRGQPGEESFDITVCTPTSMLDECAANGFVVGRHRLIVGAYDPLLIMNAIRKLVANCSGLSWAEVGTKLARIACWEFEDYRAAR
jgi:hypothetical protein